MKTRYTQRGLIVPVLDTLESPIGVYRIWSPKLPNVSYIGSTTNFQKRAHEHWRDAQTPNAACNVRQLFDVSFDDVQFEVLQYLPSTTQKFSRELLLAEEQWTMKFAETDQLLSNLCGYTWSDLSRTERRSDSTSEELKDEKFLLNTIRHHTRQVKYYERQLELLKSKTPSTI